MPPATFTVKIRRLRGSRLPAKDSNGLSDPYVVGDFDHFKTFRTDKIRKTLDPQWPETFEFTFETRYPDKLDKKFLKLDVFDYNKWSKEDFIGRVPLQNFVAGGSP
jgi:Ca2+-dependent lipid-binding protein